MSSTDERIVRMEFDNAKFKKGAQETKQALTDVDASLTKAGNNKGLMSMESNMGRVQVAASKMAIVTTTAIATITNKAVNAGINMARSLTIDPFKQGFQEYESLLTKQNVIMNATSKSAGAVKKVLNDLNKYSDETIYSFADMTNAITKFTNAGVSLPVAVQSIRGIANAAAYAGASTEEAGRGMYAFSQAMSAGFMGLQDWNQIENANMGTIRFKQELLNAAVAAGTLTKRGKEYVTQNGKVVSATKGWRDSLQEQWMTTEVLNKTLGKYSDTTTKLGKEAQKSATEVRTFSAFMDTLKESIGSGWAQVIELVSGDLETATKKWTRISEAVGGVVDGFFTYLTTTLKVWKEMGGYEKAVKGFMNILSPFVALIKAIGVAFKTAFPSKGPGSGEKLYALSAAFEFLTRPLTLLADVITGLTPALTIFFSIVKMGGMIVGTAFGAIKDFVSALLGLVDVKIPSGGGLLGWLQKVADEVTKAVGKLDELLSKGRSLTSAFGGLDFNMPEMKLPSMPDVKMPSMPKMPSIGKSDIKAPDTSSISGLAAPIAGLTEGLVRLKGSSEDVANSGVFNPNAKLDTSQIVVAGENTSVAASKMDQAKSILGDFGEFLRKIGGWIADFFEGFDAEDLMASFNLAVISTFMLKAAKMMDSFGGVFDSLNETISNFVTAQKREATAKVIIAVAIALGVLAASLWVLSKIPVDGLVKSIAALGAATWVLNKFMDGIVKMVEGLEGKGVNLKLIAVSLAMVALGTALMLLATAFRIMNKVDFMSVVKGLGTVWVLMLAMEKLGNLGQHAAKNMVAAAFSIGVISAAMIGLAAALLMFKFVDWGAMGKAGVALLAVSLAVGALAMIPYQGIGKVGLAMLAASVGMNAIAVALMMFALVKWESIVKAGVALLGITAALGALMLIGNPMTVGGFVSLASAMVLLAGALIMLNAVDWSSLVKLAAAFGILLVAVAALMAILYVAAPVVPVLALFAAALLALGVALAAFSAAMAIAMGLAAAGTAAFAALGVGAAMAIAMFIQTLALQAPVMKNSMLMILKAMIDGIVEAVPMVINGIKRLWNAIMKELQGNDKKKSFGDAGESWLDRMKDKIKEKIPDLVDQAKDLAIKFLKALRDKAADMGGEAARFIARFVDGVANNIGPVITAGTNLVIKFIQGISSNASRIAEAGADAVIKFVNATAENIRTKGPELGKAMGNLGKAMVQGLIGGIGSMFSEAMGAIGDLAGGMVDKAKSILKIFSPSRVFKDIGKFLVKGLTVGIQNNAASAINAVAKMVSGQIAMATEYIDKFIQRLDQRALAARARAEGLAAAAETAAKKAEKTKNKKDDKAAKQLQKEANAAAKKADKLEAKADKAKEKQERKEQFKEASLIEKAQMRSEDAQRQLELSKNAEKKAAKLLAQADALERQARAKGVGKKQRKELLKEAEELREQAKKAAQNSNKHLKNARASAKDALAYQKKAGQEAAKQFQEAWDNQEKRAAEEAAFAKMTDSEKAAERRRQAEELEKKSREHLAEAKKLAYTDLEKANELAAQALEEAEQARQYMEEAESYGGAGNQGLGGNGTVVDLALSDSASGALAEYENALSRVAAASATTRIVEFNQNNYSPEALSPTEIYRQSRNLVNFAADQLTNVPA